MFFLGGGGVFLLLLFIFLRFFWAARTFNGGTYLCIIVYKPNCTKKIFKIHAFNSSIEKNGSTEQFISEIKPF